MIEKNDFTSSESGKTSMKPRESAKLQRGGKYKLNPSDQIRVIIFSTDFLCIFCIKNYIGTQGEVCTVKGL